MKARLIKRLWIAVLILLVAVIAKADTSSNTVIAANDSLVKTLLELRAQGFKTDLTNFDFSTPPEARVRQRILEGTIPDRRKGVFLDHPDLMEPTESNQIVVVWKQNVLRRQTPALPDPSYELTWEDFSDAINQNEPEIDVACATILSGPIQFNLNASAGDAMLLPHLALLKNLTQMLNDRTMLALHDGNLNVAWTNLMAATRLVTAWNPEPVEISHRVRFDDAKLVFKATWQALQTNGWTDEQLVRLQQEWTTADFLSGLPEVEAFERACVLKALEQVALTPEMPEDGKIIDEERLLIFYRDREIELSNAIQTGSWLQMSQMPGVTNRIYFEPKYHYRGPFEPRLQHRRLSMAFASHGTSFLGQAIEAETERRILICALALERFHRKNGHYPETLQALVPEFKKSEPMDFITGQPLHCRVTENGKFLIYSVGLDCVDNGGKVPTLPTEEERFARLTSQNKAVSEFDIVWPLAASPGQIVAFRNQQSQAVAERKAQRDAAMRLEEQRNKQDAEESRQAAMKRLLAEKPSLGKEPVYQGKPLSSWVDKLGQIERYNGVTEDAVSAIRAIGPKAVPFLLEWMPHPGAEHPVEGYPSDLEFVWCALGADGKSAIPALANIINRPQHKMDDYTVWTQCAKAISYLGPDAIVPMLTVATNMQGQHELWELLHNFRNLGTNGAAAVPALIHWANDPDSWVRDGVVSALGGIGKRPDLAVPVLTNALHDSDWMVRRAAGEALGSFAKDSDAVLPLLIKTVKDPVDWQARGGALSGLGKIHDKSEVVVPVIAPYLYDENNVIQRTAAYALRDLGSEAGFRALLQASNAPSSWPGIGDIIYEVQQKSLRDKSK